MEIDCGLSILFEDRHLIAVNKPARISVASDESGDESLLEKVRARNLARQSPGKKGYCVPIHFLDRPVSGVVVFALSSKAATRLNEQFRSRSLNKYYFAITENIPGKPDATLVDWLEKDHNTNKTRVANKSSTEAKRSELSYRVLATHQNSAFLEVRPVTGRSHQIRVQLAAIGCPLVGDVKYGAKKPWNNLVALHAACLQLKHPVGNADLNIRAGIPDYWHDVWPSRWPRGTNNGTGSISEV